MSFLSDLVGGGNFEKPVPRFLDSVHTSDEERLKAQAVLKKLDLEELQILDRAFERQSEINLVEAKHKSIFVAGWRPAIGWIGGFSLAWQFLIADFIVWSAELAQIDFDPPPSNGDRTGNRACCVQCLE